MVAESRPVVSADAVSSRRIGGRLSMAAVGSSMFPLVPAGSTLELGALEGHQVRVGDILVFVSAAGMVAHRVVGAELAAPNPRWLMRGDAQHVVERVPQSAVAYRVTRVSYRGLSYATSGHLGRALARFGVRRGLVFGCLGLVARLLSVLHRRARKLRAQSR